MKILPILLVEIDAKEDTALLSPYITAHIKRFGDYFMEYEAAQLITANQNFDI